VTQLCHRNTSCGVGGRCPLPFDAALDDVAREFLFEPLGITDFAWTKNSKSGILEVGGLRLRSRDLAKIGQLVVNGGIWNGRQIVSQKWVKESAAAHIGPAHLTYFYGYQ
jgi:CubicO group peptidase (beta-lactamase class C family)